MCLVCGTPRSKAREPRLWSLYCSAPCRVEAERRQRIGPGYRVTGQSRYTELYLAQGGCCWICEKVLAKEAAGPLDHDHKTGRVRGLLCSRCNTGLGLFKDDPALLERAILYLRRPVEEGTQIR